ncbi:MAG: hypothetical protein ACYDCO_13435 [Armatimonadota bacterium]
MTRRFRKLWPLLLIAAGLVVAGVVWWTWFRVPRLRLVAKYSWSEIETWTPFGFCLQETVGKKLAFCAYDWSGRLLARSTPLPLPPEGTNPNYTFYYSPSGHWLLTSLLQGDGTTTAWTLWHDGKIVRSETLPACPFAEMRDDGTAWLFGSTGATLQVYAMQAKRTLTARDRVPIVSDDIYCFDRPILSCAILPANPVMPSWGGSPGELSADATTLTVDAYHRDNIGQDTQMPHFATYKLRIAGGRLLLHRTRVDTSKLAVKPRSVVIPRTVVAGSGILRRSTIPKPAIPHEARIGEGTAHEWLIPGWQRLPEGWTCDATADKRYALVTYTVEQRQISRLLRSLHLLRDDGQALTRDFFNCELYERPGILRGRVKMPITAQYPYALLAPDRPVVLVRIGDEVRLYSL